jgi:hypothetical protein
LIVVVMLINLVLEELWTVKMAPRWKVKLGGGSVFYGVYLSEHVFYALHDKMFSAYPAYKDE